MTATWLLARQALTAGALSAGLFSFAAADEPVRLPSPLEEITLDLGLLNDHFELLDYKLHPSGEFKSLGRPQREIREQTLVWTLRAKADISGRQAAQLFERPAFPRVKFYATASGGERSADARDEGYFLVTDRRWIRGDGPALKAGDRIVVYAPLGKNGAADLKDGGASKVVFERAKEARRRRRQRD